MGRRIISQYMAMPDDFRYRDAFFEGERLFTDGTTNLRHPRMSPGKRAKIFSPFAAMVGFDEELKKKDVLYQTRKICSEEELEILNKRIAYLQENLPIEAEVEYFELCRDINNDAYLKKGQVLKYKGKLRKIDDIFGELIFAQKTISFKDILDITYQGCETDED